MVVWFSWFTNIFFVPYSKYMDHGDIWCVCIYGYEWYCMNERIRELAEEAGFQYINEEGIGWAGNHNSSLPKFAELIVRECAKIADVADENECEWIGGNILTRFGVKE
jgi:hypothetical protein